MKTKSRLGVVMLALWLVGSTAGAQERSDPPSYPSMEPAAQPGDVPVYAPPSPLRPNATPERVATQPGSHPGGLSDWIVYRRPGCEGAHGHVSPMYTELYLQAGPTFPVGTTLSRELRAGWSITGGLRALFFNEGLTSAWTIDGHIINTNLGAGGEGKPFDVTFFHNGVRSDLVVHEGVAGRKSFTVQVSNRTQVGLGVGKEYYLWAPADAPGKKWRLGYDLGGRYGSHRVDFNEFGHMTDVVGGLYAACHSDIEIPCGRLLWQFGARLEWAYTWSDVLQTISDVQDVSLLIRGGIRY